MVPEVRREECGREEYGYLRKVQLFEE